MAENKDTDTAANLITELRPILDEVLGIMDRAAAVGITLNFGIGYDPANKKNSITVLSATKSYL